jgi:two-component system response regulator HydG
MNPDRTRVSAAVSPRPCRDLGSETTPTISCPPMGLPPLLESLTEPAITVDSNYRILEANQAYRDRFNGGRRVCGQLCHEVSHHFPVPCDQAGECCPLASARDTGERCQYLHLHHHTKGEAFEIASVYPLRDGDGKTCGFLEILSPTAIADVEPGKDATLIGHSAPFVELLNLISRVAPTQTTVLLLGESGTGKELVARAVHRLSSRAQQPFVPLECSGLTETLFESELFGHERGSFTGAHNRKRGLVEAANSGTLFLDEIGDIPLSLQVKLLRLLETGRFRRVGSVQQIHSDFRLVCATHRDLGAMVEAGDFREDLYYRISAFPVRLPPLRERIDDLELLTHYMFGRLGCSDRCRLHPEAAHCLERYAFPGNIRELHNILERACLLADDGIIRPEHLPAPETTTDKPSREVPFPLDQKSVLPIDVVESRYIHWLTRHFEGSRAQLADLLGISERTLYRKMHDH